MSGYHIQRYRPLRRPRARTPLVSCAVLLIVVLLACGVGTFVLLPRLTEAAASLVGLQTRGQTSTVFSQAEPLPPVAVIDPVAAARITVAIPSYGQRTIDVQSQWYQVVTGSDNGGTLAVVTAAEQHLIGPCAQYTPICQNADPRIQNLRVDLRTGGAIVYADVALPELGGIAQQVGAVLRIDATGRQFELAGLDIGGTLYAASGGQLAGQIAEVERLANQVLNELTLSIERPYRLDRIQIDEQMLTVVLR